MTTPRISRRKLHAEDTKRAIIACARAHFGSSGFAKTSLHEIAADAGVTIGAVYHHFGSKAKLFDDVFVDVESELRTLSQEAARRRPTTAAAHGRPDGPAAGGRPDDTVVDRLLRSFDAYLTAIEDPRLRQIVLIDAPSVLGVERCNDVFDTYGRSGIRAGLARAQQDGMQIVGGVDIAARLVFGALIAATGPPGEPGERHRPTVTRRSTMRALAAVLNAVVVPPADIAV